MTHSRDQVVASVEATFPKSGRARVLDLLDSYGVEPYERECERVQVAILTLGAGSEAKVREYVAVAKRDYRDVLFRSEERRVGKECRCGWWAEQCKKKG